MYSNTSCLADLGWRGLYVEPVPDFAASCRRRHAGNPGVQVAECAVGAAPGRLPLQVAHAFSSLHGDAITRAQAAFRAQPPALTPLPFETVFAGATVEVEVMRLDALLARHAIAPGFEVLVVDVEGHETAVFDSFDLATWQPQMIIVELMDVDPKDVETRAPSLALRGRILAAGYQHLHVDVVNSVFVRED
jgi:FkbM family methyltransferase